MYTHTHTQTHSPRHSHMHKGRRNCERYWNILNALRMARWETVHTHIQSTSNLMYVVCNEQIFVKLNRCGFRKVRADRERDDGGPPTARQNRTHSCDDGWQWLKRSIACTAHFLRGCIQCHRHDFPDAQTMYHSHPSIRRWKFNVMVLARYPCKAMCTTKQPSVSPTPTNATVRNTAAVLILLETNIYLRADLVISTTIFLPLQITLVI